MNRIEEKANKILNEIEKQKDAKHKRDMLIDKCIKAKICADCGEEIKFIRKFKWRECSDHFYDEFEELGCKNGHKFQNKIGPIW